MTSSRPVRYRTATAHSRGAIAVGLLVGFVACSDPGGAGHPRAGSTGPGSSPLKAALMSTVTVERHAEQGYVLGIHGEALSVAFDAFEAAGAYGNGPAWAALAEYLVDAGPAITGVTMDDESGAFLAYARRRAPLEALRERLIGTVSDSTTLRNAVAAAREAGFGRGDL